MIHHSLTVLAAEKLIHSARKSRMSPLAIYLATVGILVAAGILTFVETCAKMTASRTCGGH